MGPKRGEFICPMAGLNTYVQLFATVLEGSSISILNVALSITVPLHFWTTVHFHLCTSAFYTLKPSSAVPISPSAPLSFPQHVAIARGNCTWQLGTCNCIFLPVHLEHVNYATLHMSTLHLRLYANAPPLCTFAALPLCRYVRLCASVPLRLGDATLHLRAFPLRHL